MKIIRNSQPSTWQELQIYVAEFWRQCAIHASTEYDLETVRGIVNIDVYGKDDANSPPLVYLCECKYWKKPISKSVIHGFRTVVHDSGANCGYIVARSGYQSGAYDAATMTNVKLLSWDELQELFHERWIVAQMERIRQDGEHLRNYCDPLEDYISERLAKSDKSFVQKYKDLLMEYVPIGMLALRWRLEKALAGNKAELSKLSAEDPWTFMERLVIKVAEGLAAFDTHFGEQWRFSI